MMGLDDECVFCLRVAAGQYDRSSSLAVAFEPFEPVTPGHMLVLPRVHIPDVAASPSIAAETMLFAALLAEEMDDCTLITFTGPLVTQTVRHLHIHLVPRQAGDVLALPWTGQVISHG